MIPTPSPIPPETREGVPIALRNYLSAPTLLDLPWPRLLAMVCPGAPRPLDPNPTPFLMLLWVLTMRAHLVPVFIMSFLVAASAFTMFHTQLLLRLLSACALNRCRSLLFRVLLMQSSLPVGSLGQNGSQSHLAKVPLGALGPLLGPFCGLWSPKLSVQITPGFLDRKVGPSSASF